MSFETMEALLVKKIAGLRASEAMFARSLQVAQSGAAGVELTTAQSRLNAQLVEVEQLLSAMTSKEDYSVGAAAAMLPVDAARPMSAPVWM